jgi:hypothetical protein
MCLRNVGICLQIRTALRPKDQHGRLHRRGTYDLYIDVTCFCLVFSFVQQLSSSQVTGLRSHWPHAQNGVCSLRPFAARASYRFDPHTCDNFSIFSPGETKDRLNTI